MFNAPVRDPVSVCGHFFILSSIDEANDKKPYDSCITFVHRKSAKIKVSEKKSSKWIQGVCQNFEQSNCRMAEIMRSTTIENEN